MKEEAVAKLKQLRMGPRKVRLVVGLIRGLKVDNAVVQLENCRKGAARPVLKLLKSAVANAKTNHDLKEETLVVKTVFVDEGQTLHRWMPRAMGRATPIRKRGSHITIVLEGEASETKKTKKTEKVVESEVLEVEDKKPVNKKEVKK